MLVISPSARVSPLADIEDSVRGTRIVIGDDVFIDSFVRIRPVGGVGDVIIGARCYINSGTVIYSGNGVHLGEGVLIAANCTLAPVNHAFTERSRTILEQRFAPSRGGIQIEDDVWIGANSVVLDGAHLRKGCVIGAQSLVTGEVPEYSVNVGNPLRVLSYRK